MDALIVLGRTVLWLACFASVAEAWRRVLASVAHDGSWALALPAALGSFAYLTQPLMRVVDGGLAAPVLGAVGVIVASRFPKGERSPAKASTSDIFGVVVCVLIAVVLASTELWDRRIHVSLVGGLSRGVVPLEHPGFPGVSLRYHAGFDFIAASVRTTTGLDLHTSIEAVQFASIVAVVLGTRHLLRCHFSWPLPLLAAGPLALFTGAIPMAGSLTLLATFSDPYSAVPPAVSGLFQPAFALGWALLPLLAALVRRHALRASLLLAVLLLFLSEMNLVFFGLCGLGCAAVAGRSLVRERTAPATWNLVVLGLPLAIWWATGTFQPRHTLALGGFFSGQLLLGSIVFLIIPLLFAAAVGVRAWRAGSLGVTEDGELFLVVVTVVGVGVGAALHDVRTWDIVKFLHVAVVASATGLAMHLPRLPRAAQWIGVGLGSAAGLAWCVRFGPANGPVFSEYRGDSYDEAALEILASIGDQIPGDACMFTPALVAINAGIRAPGDDPKNFVALIDDAAPWEQRRRQWQRAMEQPTAAHLAEFGCPYVFVPDRWLPPDADGRLFGVYAPRAKMELLRQPWTLYVLTSR